MRWPLVGCALGIALAAPRSAWGQVALPIFDDFDSGTLFTGDVPPGRWESLYAVGGNSASATDAGAHEGTYGFRAIDAVTSDTDQVPCMLQRSFVRDAGERYFRQWVRITPSSTVGIPLIGLLRDGVSGQNTCTLHVTYPSAELTLGSHFDGGASFLKVDAGVAMTSGVWRLIECAVFDGGTPNATLVLWVDGVERVRQNGVYLPGLWPNQLQVGEPWSDDGRFVGAIDVDDPAVTSVPPASRLLIDAGTAPVIAGTCTPVEVQLRSSSGVAATALRSHTLVVSTTGPSATVYGDEACSTTAPPVITAGQSSIVLGLIAQPGALTLSIGTPDLLGTVAPISVATGGGPGGGGPLDLQVACGCGADAASVASLGPVLVVLWVRRRRGDRHLGR